MTCYCTALTLRPHFPEARRLLALAYCVIGQPEKAILMCEAWLRSEPDDPLARHTLAAVSGRDVPARASDAYVQKTFDSFAASFEVKLAKLHYRAPALVAARLTDAGSRRHEPSISSTPDAARDCAARCSHPTRVAWSVSICRAGCWLTQETKRSTTSW